MHYMIIVFYYQAKTLIGSKKKKIGLSFLSRQDSISCSLFNSKKTLSVKLISIHIFNIIYIGDLYYQQNLIFLYLLLNISIELI